MPVRLTETAISKAIRDVSSAGARRDLADAGCPGLRLRLTPAGGKSWFLACRDRLGRMRRFPPLAFHALRARNLGQLRPLVAAVAWRDRATALLRPDIGPATLLADTRLILQPELDRLTAGFGRNGGGDQLGVVFLCVSWAATSASGWRGRTERRRKRKRRSSFPTLRSCNSTLNSRAILWRRSITRQRTTPSVSRSGPVRTHSANVASCAGVSLETAPPPCGRSDKPVTPAAL